VPHARKASNRILCRRAGEQIPALHRAGMEIRSRSRKFGSHRMERVMG
jgi:hypothetical protein